MVKKKENLEEETTATHWWQSFKNFLYLNPIKEREVEEAFLKQRRNRVQWLLLFFVLTKIGHIAQVITPFYVHLKELMTRYPDLERHYPITEGRAQESHDKYVADSTVCLYQYIASLVLTIALIISIKRINSVMKALPILVGLICMFELPVYPIYPDSFFILTASGFFATIYYSSIFTCTTMLQGAPYFTILFIVFFWHVERQIDPPEAIRQLPIFFIITALDFALLMSEVTYSVKAMFSSQYAVKQQARDFEKILSSFPEGVLIATVKKVQSNAVSQADEESKVSLDMPQRSKLKTHFINSELKDFLGLTEASNDEEKMEQVLQACIFKQFFFKSDQDASEPKNRLQRNRNEKLSLTDILSRFSDGKRFFAHDREESDMNAKRATSTERSKQKDDRYILFEVQIKPRTFNGRECSLLVIRNVSHVVRQQRLQAEFAYQQLLVRTMSHEQLTPLNAILNVSDCMIESGTLDEDNKSLMKVIKSSGKILQFTVQSQLSQLQVSTSQNEFNFTKMTRFDLSQSIDEVIDPFKIQMDKRGIKAEVVIKNLAPSFKLDGKIYQEILFNLIVNAVKFNKNNGRIKIKVHSLVEGDLQLLKTSVEDTGVGIAESKQKTLFKLFREHDQEMYPELEGSNSEQVDATSGVGVGLTNSKILTEALNGSIELSSQVNRGTSVCFTVEIGVIETQRQHKIAFGKQNSDESDSGILVAEPSERSSHFILPFTGSVKQKSQAVPQADSMDRKKKRSNQKLSRQERQARRTSKATKSNQPEDHQPVGIQPKKVNSKDSETEGRQSSEESTLKQKKPVLGDYNDINQLISEDKIEPRQEEPPLKDSPKESGSAPRRNQVAAQVAANHSYRDEQPLVDATPEPQSVQDIQPESQVDKTHKEAFEDLLENENENEEVDPLLTPVVCQCTKASCLIVDDNEFNLIPLEILLKSNFNIVSHKALSGEDAVAYFIRDRKKRCCDNRIKLVLMDLNMPQMDGYQATQRIFDVARADIALKNDNQGVLTKGKVELDIKVVAVTAYVDQESVDRCYDTGMSEVLNKPVSLKDLQDVIEAFHQ